MKLKRNVSIKVKQLNLCIGMLDLLNNYTWPIRKKRLNILVNITNKLLAKTDFKSLPRRMCSTEYEKQ